MMVMFSGLRNIFKKRKPEQVSWRQVDRLQLACSQLPQIDCPLTHKFTPGLYFREIFMPQGSLVVSKVHKTEHPFVILSGAVRVWTDESGILEFRAPYVGVTKAGTRRVLYITEDCRWITFHPTKETDLKKIEDQIIEPRDVKLKLDNVQKLLPS